MTDSDVIDVVEISGFRLDRGRRRLTDSDGRTVALTSKAFDTLAYLVANPGRVVDKHEILDAVWSGVAVEENTLNHAISAVRRALGDCRTEPRFIATIQGRGYQLIAPVRTLRQEAARDGESGTRATSSADPRAGTAMASERFGGSSLALGVTAGVLVLAAAFFALTGYLPGAEVAIQYGIGRTDWLTRDSTLELDPAMSPDGRLIAYAAGPIGQTDILVRDVITGETENLTEGLPGAHGWPRWSPESDEIAFRTVLPRSIDIIHVVPAHGGDVEAIVRQPFLTGHDWSPTGTELVYARAHNLYVYSFADRSSHELPVTVPNVHSPTWSPDGSEIAVVSGNNAYVFGTDAFANIAPSAIWIVSADGSEVREITDNSSMNTSPVWAEDARSLFFLSDREGAMALYQVVLTEAGQELPSPRFLTSLSAHTLSRGAEADRLIYSELIVSNANIWALPIPADHATPIAPTLDMATQITHGTQMIEGIDVSSDGRWLLFDSNRSGNQDIYKMRLNDGKPAGDPIRLTFDPSDDFSATWSPDDSQIAFHSFRNGNRDIFVTSADGSDRQPVAVTTDPAQERYPDWSPDGSQIVFFSDTTIRWQLFTTSRRDQGSVWSGPEQITYNGGHFAKWSPLDDLIAYTYSDGVFMTIALVPPEDKESVILDIGSEIDGLYPVWAPDASRIYFKGVSANDIGIWSIKPDNSDLTQLISFENLSSSGYPRTEFAASDSHFYFTLREHDSDIAALELVELER